MSVYVWIRCPQCKDTISVGRDYRSLGPPFIQCAKCQAILRSSQTNEWDLMKRHQKIILFLRICFTALVYWGFGPAMAVMLIAGIAVRFDFAKLHLDAVGSLMLLAAVLGAAYFSIRFKQDIAASNSRLRDPEYRALLARLGFLPPNQQQEHTKYPERHTS